MLCGLKPLALGPIDDAFKHLIGKLISGVGQHQFPQHRHKRRGYQQGGIEDVREDFFQVVPPRPARMPVGQGGGDGKFLGVVENLVQLAPVLVVPQVVIAADAGAILVVVGDVQQAKLQIGPIHRGVFPGWPRVGGGFLVPAHLAEAGIQVGKEIAALRLRHELAEEQLITRGIPQLAGQFLHERGR